MKKQISITLTLIAALLQSACGDIGDNPAFGIDDSATGSTTSTASRVPSQTNFALLFSDFQLDAIDQDTRVFQEQSTDITVVVADKDGVPIENQLVNIATDWGLSEPSCITDADGRCTVGWTTSAFSDAFPNYLYFSYCVRVVAYTTGEEPFYDDNGNNVFDASDAASFYGNLFDFSNGYIDVPEPYFDRNRNGFFDDATDGVINTDSAGVDGHDAGDGLFNGADCDAGALCSPNTTTTIWTAGYIDLKDETVAAVPAAANTCTY